MLVGYTRHFVSSPSLRLPGDVVFILDGVLPVLYICFLGLRYMGSNVTAEQSTQGLFEIATETEVK